MIASFFLAPAAVALLGLVLKITLLLAAGAALAAFTARRPAALRHFVWALALSGSLLVLLLTPIAPRLAVPVPQPQVARAPVVAPAAATAATFAPDFTPAWPGVRPEAAIAASAARSARRAAAPAWPSPAVLLAALWLAGAVVVLGRCLLGHAGLARLTRAARPLAGPEWEPLVAGALAASGADEGVRVAVSAAVGSPITWGWPRAVVLLPETAAGWPLERRRAALLHELAHVARRDYLAQLVACVACAAFWFHPLVWLAARRLRVESEHACDDRVLASGTPAPEYASHLLEVARGARRLRLREQVAVSMARPSQMEGRLLAILDDTRARRALPRRAWAGAAAAACVALIPLAGLRPELVSAHPAAAAHASTPAARGDEGRLAVVEPRGGEQPAAPEESDRSGGGERFEWSGAGDGPQFDHGFSARPGGVLDVDLETGGRLTVIGGDEPGVHVSARLGGPDWRDSRVVVERTRDGVRIHAEQAGDEHSFSTDHAFEVHVPREYSLQLSSAGGPVTLRDLAGDFSGETGGGPLQLDHLRGHVHFSTGGGPIVVANSELRGSVATGGGPVQFVHVRGPLEGSSGSGPVIRTDGDDSGDVTGSDEAPPGQARAMEQQAKDEVRRGVEVGVGDQVRLDVVERDREARRQERLARQAERDAERARDQASDDESAGGDDSGPVTNNRLGNGDWGDLGDALSGLGGMFQGERRDSEGRLHVFQAGGDVSLPEAPNGASIVTGGGEIHVGPARGRVVVRTGGGGIEVGPVAGSVSAGTGAGDVHVITVPADGPQTVEVWSGTGRVVLDVPASLDARFDLESAYTASHRETHIDAPWSLEREQTQTWDDREGTPRRYVRAHGVAGSGRGLIRVRTVNGDIVVRREGR